jgi:capsular polysaccharide biosynthesis protein
MFEIDLGKLAGAVLRRWWAVMCAALVGGLIAFAITRFFMVPQYSATVKLYVNNTTETAKSITSSDIVASKSLVATYITIIRSDAVMEEVLEKTGASGYTAKSLNEMLTAGALNATEVFYVTITSASPDEATALANAVAEVAPEHLSEIVIGSSVKIVDAAKTPSEPSSPSYSMNCAIGLLLGALLAISVVALRAALDARILVEPDLQGMSELPVLGAITDFSVASRPGYGYGHGYGHRRSYGRGHGKHETRRKDRKDSGERVASSK